MFSIKSRLTKLISPVQVHHSELSMILSACDDLSPPSARLIDLSLDAARLACNIDLTALQQRGGPSEKYLNIWPGEHYKLIAAFVSATQARSVIEIGTATGLSALCMLSQLPANGTLTTFDVIPWSSYPSGTSLIEEDFADGRLCQVLDDLQDSQTFLKHEALFESADLIFIDAAKDGIMEQRFIDNLAMINFKSPPIVIFDDIKVWNMIRIWRELNRPKIDFTSLGHWSGTGIVDWSSPVKS